MAILCCCQGMSRSTCHQGLMMLKVRGSNRLSGLVCIVQPGVQACLVRRELWGGSWYRTAGMVLVKYPEALAGLLHRWS